MWHIYFHTMRLFDAQVCLQHPFIRSLSHPVRCLGSCFLLFNLSRTNLYRPVLSHRIEKQLENRGKTEHESNDRLTSSLQTASWQTHGAPFRRSSFFFCSLSSVRLSIAADQGSLGDNCEDLASTPLFAVVDVPTAPLLRISPDKPLKKRPRRVGSLLSCL